MDIQEVGIGAEKKKTKKVSPKIIVSVQADLAKSSAGFINDGTGRPFK